MYREAGNKPMPAPQLVANQANAQLPTGPVTAEGKTRSARNALRHGLTAKNPLLPEEDREEYQRHCEIYLARFAWRDECERQLIRRMADIEWRLLRIPYIESALMEVGEFAALSNIAMYQQRLQRTKEKALANCGSCKRHDRKKNQKWVRFSKTRSVEDLLRPVLHRKRRQQGLRALRQQNHLITEQEFHFRYPMEIDSDGNVVIGGDSLPAGAALFAQQLQLDLG
jgi:hypothetical protein